MCKMMFALVLALGASVAAQAQWNMPPAQAPAGAAGGGSVYGWNPALKRNLFWWKKDACGTGGCNTGCAGGNCGQIPGLTGPMPGTLVFPQHQFIRSPRDFFMAGETK
jgi:hypothetical protein